MKRSTRTDWTRRLGAALLVAILALGAKSGAAAQESRNLADIVARVEAQAKLPPYLRMNQEVSVRALIFSWRFTSVLERHGDEMTATTQGAPSFMPETFPIDLVSLTETLDVFNLRVLSESSKEGYLVIGGARPDYDGMGAEEATFSIDPDDWLIKRATAKYAWGTLTLEQEFVPVEGYQLLSRQKATVRPHGFTVDVNYTGHTLLAATAERP